MNPILLLVVAVAGGIGSVLRFVLDSVITSRIKVRFPLGTNIINVSGSFLLGLLIGVATGGTLNPITTLALSAGLLGGYTTFSTASLETVRLVMGGRGWAAALNGIGTLLLGLAASASGMVLGIAGG